jgi:hypothetical protein
MKLNEFISNLTRLITEHPEAADYDVVVSKDDEGNGFSLIHYDLSIGHYVDDEFITEDIPPNAVCVN